MINLPDRLYKYGEAKHIKDLIYSGKLCLNAASSYGEKEKQSRGAFDPKERVVEQTLPSGSEIEIFDPESHRYKGRATISSGKLKATAVTDYYIFCMSSLFGNVLFEDFKPADACAVIHSPIKFLDSVSKSILSALPGWGGFFDWVNYYSPDIFYKGEVSNEDIFFAKENGPYKHQSEFRLVCVPSEPVDVLQRKTINIDRLLSESHIIYKES